MEVCDIGGQSLGSKMLENYIQGAKVGPATWTVIRASWFYRTDKLLNKPAGGVHGGASYTCYCWYYLRVLYFANFCNLEKNHKTEYPQKFLPT